MYTGSFPNGRRSKHYTAADDSHTVDVLAAFSVTPHASIRTVARQTDISRSTVHRILKNNLFHPFKLHCVQELKPSDPERKLQFISEIVCLYDQDSNILNNILWTDESLFNNNGMVNRHNAHYWNDTNPFWTRETKSQVRWSINVWCGILNNTLIGPYFYEGTLTGVRYLDFLENILPLLLENVPLRTRECMWVQQDGAPPHNSNIVKDYLNNTFPLRWTGTNGPVKWPPRSPDLTPLDFFLWGYLKDRVYTEQSSSLENLKERIIVACSSITSEMLKSVTASILTRYEKCVSNNGGHFENTLK